MRTTLGRKELRSRRHLTPIRVRGSSGRNGSRDGVVSRHAFASMNHLAHLLLAGDDPEAQVGQVLADFVTAGSIASFAPGIQAGIRAHQRIDAYADGHPVFCVARKRLRPPYRRFGGVLLDVWFDHFLATGWDQHGNGTSLAEFAQARYRVLHEYRHLRAPRFRVVVEAMRQDDWLVAYSELSFVDRVLHGISRRFKRENPIGSALPVLLENYEALRSDFEEFFPELKAYAGTLRPRSRGPASEANLEGHRRIPQTLPAETRRR